jgi:hypothetical protein
MEIPLLAIFQSKVHWAGPSAAFPRKACFTSFPIKRGKSHQKKFARQKEEVPRFCHQTFLDDKTVVAYKVFKDYKKRPQKKQLVHGGKNEAVFWLKNSHIVGSCWGKQRCIFLAESNYMGIDAVAKDMLILDIISITQVTSGGGTLIPCRCLKT